MNVSILKRNNQVANLLVEYLNEYSCAVDAEDIKNSCEGNPIAEEAYYRAFIEAFVGLDVEKNDYHKLISEKYFSKTFHRLDVSQYANNEYLQTIKIADTKIGNWELSHISYAPYEAFICDDIIVENDGTEIPQIGFFTDRFTYPVVKENGREWMAIKPSEISTMESPISMVSGNIVTFGLGMGYYAFMTSQKKEVDNVTIVERDKNVIELFRKYILPQFPQREKITIVEADAMSYINDMPDDKFNYAFVDLWHDTSDGLPIYKQIKLKEQQFLKTKFLYWVERSLKSALQWEKVFQNE